MTLLEAIKTGKPIKRIGDTQNAWFIFDRYGWPKFLNPRVSKDWGCQINRKDILADDWEVKQ